MRCPVCGYHSFEHMEQCKKCGRDLKEFKARYGIFGRFFSSDQDKLLEDSQEPPETVGEVGENFTTEVPSAFESSDSEVDANRNQSEQDPAEPVEEFVEESPEEPPLSVQETPEVDDNVGEKPFDFFVLSEEQKNQLNEMEAENLPDLSRSDDGLSIELDGQKEVSQGDENFHQEFSGAAGSNFEKESWPFEDSHGGEQKELDVPMESPALFVAKKEQAEIIGDYPPEMNMKSSVEEIGNMESQIFPRLGAWLADCSILSLILLAFVVLGKIGLDSQPRQGLFPTQAALLVELLIPYFFLFFSLCFGYFTVFHFLTGQTPGKMLFNIRVEDEKGFPLLFSQAFLRSTGGLLSFLLLGLGYLMIFFNQDGRGWNDRLAGTRIVRVEPQQVQI